MKYIPTTKRAKAEISEILKNGTLQEKSDALWSATCTVNDYKWAQELCHRYSESDEPLLRGCAIIGLSNIARTTGKLDKAIAKPLLLRALKDENEIVRGKAQDAIDDVNHCFKWRIAMRKKG